jgi:predicted TIM-barrel fold metal-dependent hydrolase
VFERYRRFGAVAFKDQSAYEQTIAFGEPDRKKAQELFDWFMADPRRELEFPGAQKPLGDYLFHRFMGMAADMQLPVQVHTGELAGVRNDIRRADALHLIPILDRCRDVRFDLFHVNWPHGDSMLFLGKNYPNVSIDLCWANIIDPVFCQNFLKQALSSMPHGKIHGYGSDFMGFPDRVWAHLSIARDNIAVALSQMVDMEYLSLDEAKQVAREWLYENPKAFYRLSC